MKKRTVLRSISAVAVLILCVFFFSACNASDPYAYETDSAFSITKLNIEINVGENRKTEVTEKVTVLFNDYRRGIIRDLPTNSGEVYQDISLEGDEYFLSSSSDFIFINTGAKADTGYKSPGTSITYTIKYTIIPPSNTFGSDNFYMNIVPQGYPTTVKDVSVTVNFPYGITDYVLYCGKWGESEDVERSPFTASVSGSSFTLTADSLSAYYGASLQAKLEKNLGGYTNAKTVLAVVVVAVLAVGALLLIMFTKRKKPVEVVNFYPPKLNGKALNPAQTGMLIDNNVEASDITALIFYWASKGYLLIENAQKGSKSAQAGNPFEASGSPFETYETAGNQTTGSQKTGAEKLGELILVKLKEPDGEHYETKLFNKIFASGNRVNISSLENKLYIEIQSAQAAVKREYSGKLFDRKRALLSGIFAICPVAAAFIGCLIFGLSLNGSFLFLKGALAAAPVIGAYVLGIIGLFKKHKIKKTERLMLFLGQILAAAVLSGVAIYFIGGAVPLLARIALCALSGLCGVIAPYFVDYTDFYADILGQILGFKNFLTAAEKSRLEMLLEENPQYYYDILPYANVLGVSEIWQDKFKGLTIAPPAYYNSRVSVFDIIIFNALYRNMFRRINTVSVSRPSNSSKSGGFRGGGGGFGGGFSGGGFGGGGMRSR